MLNEKKKELKMGVFAGLRIEDLPKYRKDKGITQKQVAESMGTVQPAVARWEKALLKGHVPSVGTLEKYVKALNLDIKIQISEPV